MTPIQTMFSCFLSIISTMAFSSSITLAQPSDYVEIFDNKSPNITQVTVDKLPKPYDFLLTQPLMTTGLETCFQRRGAIKVIQAVHDKQQQRYTRTIVMIMDQNKTRNDPLLAQNKQEAWEVELAKITINFQELPGNIKSAILNTNTPFGKLLVENKLKTWSSDRTYFSIPCSANLEKLTNCLPGSKLYGRTNTINRADNNHWLARVVEILPRPKCVK